LANIDRGLPWVASVAVLLSLAVGAAGQIPSTTPVTPQTREQRGTSVQKLRDAAKNRGSASQADLSRIPTLSPDLSAIEYLLKTPNQQDALKLAELIDQPDPKKATEICSALGEGGDSIFVPVALRGLERQSDPGAQETCAKSVARLNAPDGFAGLNRIALSDQQPVSARLAAIHALARASAEQAPSLIPLLTNQDHRLRAAAAYSACQLRLSDAVPSVAALAADPDPEVRQAAIEAMSLWPEAFNKELVAIASNPKESEDNRILGLTALDASSAGQKNAALVKSISSLLDVEQPPDVQMASVQLLSEVPEARTALEQFSKQPGMRPEVLDRMETLGIRVQPAEIQGKEVDRPFRRVVDDHSAAWFGLAGVILGGLFTLAGNLLLEVLKQRAKKKRDEPRKQLLKEMLEDERFPGRWRELHTLMHVIGADEETTKRLLIEIGARGSEDGMEFWGLIKHHPFDEKN
jgi:hypothetical protein